MVGHYTDSFLCVSPPPASPLGSPTIPSATALLSAGHHDDHHDGAQGSEVVPEPEQLSLQELGLADASYYDMQNQLNCIELELKELQRVVLLDKNAVWKRHRPPTKLELEAEQGREEALAAAYRRAKQAPEAVARARAVRDAEREATKRLTVVWAAPPPWPGTLHVRIELARLKKCIISQPSLQLSFAAAGASSRALCFVVLAGGVLAGLVRCTGRKVVSGLGRGNVKVAWERDALRRHQGSVVFPLEKPGDIMLLLLAEPDSAAEARRRLRIGSALATLDETSAEELVPEALLGEESAVHAALAALLSTPTVECPARNTEFAECEQPEKDSHCAQSHGEEIGLAKRWQEKVGCELVRRWVQEASAAGQRARGGGGLAAAVGTRLAQLRTANHGRIMEAKAAGCEWFLPAGSLPGAGAGDEEQKEVRAGWELLGASSVIFDQVSQSVSQSVSHLRVFRHRYLARCRCRGRQ
jgi:hypothetical protein